MSRYYSIALTPAPTATKVNTSPTRIWTSFPNGVNDPGALNVEFDFFTFESKDNSGFSTITIYGISLQDIQQAQNFAGMLISVKGGMQAGLPLANPKQAGTILQGQIFQSFGNWVRTEMTLSFVINAFGSTFSNPKNLILKWPKNTSLANAIEATLNVAYPGVKSIINISDKYILPYDVYHAVSTLKQLSKMIHSLSASIKAPGVNISIQPDNTIIVYDGSVSVSTPKQIEFNDLIGQPTWIEQNQMQFMTVMRADVQVNSLIRMPQGLQNAPGIVTTNASALPSSMKYKTAFQGNFIIQSVRHIGNFRDPNGASWSTVFQCAPQGA